MDQQCECSENYVIISKPKESDIALTASFTPEFGWLHVCEGIPKQQLIYFKENESLIDIVPETMPPVTTGPQQESAPIHVGGKNEKQKHIAPTGVEPRATTSASPMSSVATRPHQVAPFHMGGGDTTQKTTETVVEHDVTHVPPSAGNATTPDGHKLADGSKSLGQNSNTLRGYVNEFTEKFSKAVEKLPPTRQRAVVFLLIFLIISLLVTLVAFMSTVMDIHRRKEDTNLNEDSKYNIMSMKFLMILCTFNEFKENGGNNVPVFCADQENRFKSEFDSLLNFHTMLKLMKEQDWLIANRNMWRVPSRTVDTEDEKTMIPDIIYYLENKGLLPLKVFDRSRYSIMDCWNDPMGTVDCITELWAPKFL